MNLKFSAYFLLLVCTFLLGCKNNLVEKKEFDDQNNLVAVYTVNKKTHDKEGEYRKLYPNGNVREIAHYYRDTIHGERKLFFESGQLEVIENYAYGQFHGKFESYYVNGNRNVIGDYLNNEATGTWKRYYETGELMEEVEMRNNEENGPFKEYYKNGKLKTKGEYVNGPFEHGELIMYDDHEQPIKKMQCQNGECLTTWTKETGDIEKK